MPPKLSARAMSKELALDKLTCPGVVEDFCIEDHQHLNSYLVQEWDIHGYWTEFVVKDVPFEKISYKTWIAERQMKTTELLKATGKTKPIKLGRYDAFAKKYPMIDGNHRCSACVEAGYTSIPAIVEERHKTPPFGEHEMEKWRFYNYVSAWLFDWKFEKKNMIFTMMVHAISGLEVETIFYAENEPIIAYISKTPNGLMYTVSSLQFESHDEQAFLDKVGELLKVNLNPQSNSKQRFVRDTGFFNKHPEKYFH